MACKGLAAFAGALLLVSTVHSAPGHAPAPCAITRAHYHLSSQATFGLTFVNVGKKDDWISDLALKITPGSGPSYWFLFDAGSARYTNLISTSDVTAKAWEPTAGATGDRPLGEMHYFAWSLNYRFDEQVPTSGTPAPERIFLPDLADVMWYRASPRLSVPHGVFVLDRCE